MFGLLFFYWIWIAFSNLAKTYNKNKWKYFFIGLVSYFVIGFLSAIIYGIVIIIINGLESLDNENFDDPLLNLFFTAFAGLGCYGAYKFLDNRSRKQIDILEKEGIESIGLVEEI